MNSISRLERAITTWRDRLRSETRRMEGFTLVEVMIAMFVLVWISLAIYQATTQVYRRREVLQAEGEFFNHIRLAMGVLDRDVAAVYSPLMMVPEASSPSTPPPGNPGATQDTDPAMQEMLSGELGRATPFWNPAVHITGIRPSRFVGEANKMTFISASHVRIYKDLPETEFTKVTYELRDDPFPIQSDNTAKALFKITNPSAFDSDDGRLIKTEESRERSYLLLGGIKSLRLRYWLVRPDGTGRWENRWDSDSIDYKDKIPAMVEATIEVDGPARLNHTGTYVMKTEIPINGFSPTF